MEPKPPQQPKPPPSLSSGGGGRDGRARGQRGAGAGRRGGGRGGQRARGSPNATERATSNSNNQSSGSSEKDKIGSKKVDSVSLGSAGARGSGKDGPRATGRGSNDRAPGRSINSQPKKQNPQPKNLSHQQQSKSDKDTLNQNIQQQEKDDDFKKQADLAAKLEAEKKAEDRRQKKLLEDNLNQLKQSRDIIQTIIDTCSRHAEYRAALEPDTLVRSRKTFEATKKALKTDLKKCTAFVKKVKSGSTWSMPKAELIKEVQGLNLTRYVEELVFNVMESQPKASEIDALTAFCVCLHERYAEFMPSLIQGLKDGLLNGQNVKTKRLNLRILTEFYVIGLFTESKLLIKVVADAAGAKETGSNETEYAVQDSGLLVAFAKSAGFEIFERLPTSAQKAITDIQSMLSQVQSCEDEATKQVLPSVDLLEEANNLIAQLMQAVQCRYVNEEICKTLTKHCMGAYQFMASSLVQTHIKLVKLEKRCEQDRILSGALPEAREKGLADARKLKENLEKSVEALADSLDQSIPLLEANDEATQDGGGGLEVWTKGGGSGDGDFGPFGDEETRSFYCDIPDLLATIPPALLGMTHEQVEKLKEENKIRLGGNMDQEIDEVVSDPVQMTEAELIATEGVSTEELDHQTGKLNNDDNKDTPHYRLTTILEQELPECHQRAQIDELSERFCTNHGSSKGSRKRLARTLFLVPRNRLDLLPYYARMTATIDRIWPDVAEALIAELEQQFHGQTKFKKNQNIESRFRTARYIGELTKFSVAPPIVFLRCVRRCLDDFTGSNVDVLCCLMESCGRYVYRLNKQANARLSALMEVTTRLSKAKNLDERSQSLIKAALYSVNPPPAGPRKQAKQYPPLESFLRNVFLVNLNSSNTSIAFVSKLLARLPWDDPSYNCGASVAKIMLKACRKGTYKTIQAIAAVSERVRSQRRAGEITVRLIDLVLEELRRGLEHPDFRDQQRALTYARLLGELYNYNLVAGHVLFQQLFDFINLGHEIPSSLRQASQKLIAESSQDSSSVSLQLPVYHSAIGISQTIQEDEELEDAELKVSAVIESEQPKPIAVSEHSVHDPRVLTPTDPPNSAFRIKLVCTLLETATNALVTKANLQRLKVFLIGFQRYLFVKSTLPVEVEFSLLDTFDALDSRWRQVTKGMPAKEDGFPRYTSWLDAHNAAVAIEELGLLEKVDANMEYKSDRFGLDDSLHDEDTNSQLDEDEESLESDASSVKVETDLVSEGAGTADRSTHSFDEGMETDSLNGDELEEEEEFDEEVYMRQLEEEAFERELRKLTMEALEKGKNVSRKQVAEYMPSGSQISMLKKKTTVDPTSAGSATGGQQQVPSTVSMLGGKVGVNLQVLKKGTKGKIEVKALVVPADTKLAQIASKKDDEALRERDAIKERVLRYEAESANSEYMGGNVYLEQEKLVKIRNRLSMEDIDKNFGTSGGNLRTNPSDNKAKQTSTVAPQVGRLGAGRGGTGRGRGGRTNTSGRTLFG